MRVEFGIGDAEPTSWSGCLNVSGGELAGLHSLRPRYEDKIDGNTWELATWQGPSFWYSAPKPLPVDSNPINIFNSGRIVEICRRAGLGSHFKRMKAAFASTNATWYRDRLDAFSGAG